MVFIYIMHGLKKIKEPAGTDDNQNTRSEAVEALVKFFDSIEDFKHCEDEVRAAALFDSLSLTLDHIPGHMLKSEEVRTYHNNNNNVVYYLDAFWPVYILHLNDYPVCCNFITFLFFLH